MLLGYRSPSLVDLSDKKFMTSDMEDNLHRRAMKISIQKERLRQKSPLDNKMAMMPPNLPPSFLSLHNGSRNEIIRIRSNISRNTEKEIIL
jgi:hypothetical protein